MFNAWHVCNATNSHCRRRAWLVHIAAWGIGNFALPPEDSTSSHCRLMAWAVHIADGILDRGFDKFALPPEDLARSHCSPNGLASSHCRFVLWQFALPPGDWTSSYFRLSDGWTCSYCCQNVGQGRIVARGFEKITLYFCFKSIS